MSRYSLVAILALCFCGFTVVVAQCETKECCDAMKAKIEKKENASNVLCSGETTYQNCCDEINTNIDKLKEAHQAECASIACEQYSFVLPKRSKDDYVTASSSPSEEMSAVTVCFWLKSQDTARTLYVSYNIPGSRIDELFVGAAGGSVFYVVNFGNTLATFNVADGQWHSICARWSSSRGQSTLYIDGEQKSENYIRRGYKIKTGGAWYLERRTADGDNSFEDELTNVNIWKRALSAEEIQQYANSCQSVPALNGDVLSWSDFRSGRRGAVKLVEKSTCCGTDTAA